MLFSDHNGSLLRRQPGALEFAKQCRAANSISPTGDKSKQTMLAPGLVSTQQHVVKAG